MRMALPVGFLLLAATRVSAQATALADVPFTLFQNAVIVKAVLNERDTVELLLDTGWGPLAIVGSSARRLRLGAASRDTGLVRASGLRIGNAVLRNAEFELFPSAALEPLIGPHDGILSTAFLRDFVVQIDYPAGRVRFFSRSPLAAQSGADATRVSVPMVFAPGIGYVPFTDSAFVDGRPVRALFDTGGSGAFMAMPTLISRAGIEVLPDTGPRIGIGMFGDGQPSQARVRFARVGRIAIGSMVREAPRVMIAPPQLAENANWGQDLIIGYGLFRNFVVTFDYPGRVVSFERPAAPPSSPPR